MFIPDAGVANEPLYNDLGEVYATALNEVRSSMARQTSLSLDAYLKWDILKGYRHNLSAALGYRFYNDYFKYTYGQGYNTGSDYMTACPIRRVTCVIFSGRNTWIVTCLGI